MFEGSNHRIVASHWHRSNKEGCIIRLTTANRINCFTGFWTLWSEVNEYTGTFWHFL